MPHTLLNPYATGGDNEFAGVAFDGTNDYMTRGAGLTGAVDSKLFSFVCWLKPTSAGSSYYLLANADSVGGAAVGYVAIVNGNYNVVMKNAAGATILNAISTETVTTSAWKCFMLSVDLNSASNRAAYVGDTALTMTWTTYTDDTIDFTKSDWSVGADPGGTAKYDGSLAELWFMVGTQLDFTTESVRRKFFDANPVILGSNGSNPTGTAPLIYHHIGSGGNAANFAFNRGSGGDFTITGSLTTVEIPTTHTPGVGSLTLTGYAPTITVT